MELAGRKDELRDALKFAKNEIIRANKMLAAGDITHRMFLEFEQRVDAINEEIDRIDLLIIAGEE